MTNAHSESPGTENPVSRNRQTDYHQLFLTMTQGVVYQSADGFIIAANPAAERILGVTLDEMRNRTSMDPRWHTLGEDGSELAGAEHPSMQALATGKPVLNKVLAVFHPQENRHHWLLVDAMPVFQGDDDRPCQVYVTFTDTTERKVAEAALRQSEERFRLTFQASPDAININRLHDGMYVDINPGFTSLTGYSRAEVLGRTSTEIDIWHDPNDRRRLVGGLQAEGYFNDLEAKFRRKDGRIAHARMSARVIQLEGIPHIISVTRDITEQTEALEALQANEKLLTSILRTAPTAIGVVSNRLLTAVNDRMCSMTGYSKEELLGKNPRMLYLSDADYQDDETEKHRQTSRYGSGTIEIRWLRKDGEAIDILMSSSPINPNNQADGVTFAALDISSRKHAEAERERLQAQLTQAHKMESVGRLAGGVAHDFNNMLGVILGHAEMALNRLDPGQPLFASLQEISKAAERSADLTRQLLAFARKQTVAPKVLDLNETVGSMLTMLRRLIGEDIDLAWLPGKNPASVNMDPSQLDQILANLCVNARDAIIDTGKVTIETDIAAFDEAYCRTHAGFVPGEYVLLAVSDNGCGMDSETKAHLFEPFFTTKEIGKGTGLGLATIYGIVKQNSGFINVYSEVGQGTALKVYLPRYAAKAAQAAKGDAASSEPRGNESILLVEDEPMILGMATTMLELQGYKVLPAATPGEAIRLAREHAGEIHLLMTDVVMPEMNGRDLAKNLLSLYPNIKRLFMSGYTANVIAHHGVLDAGVHFIQKPFSINDFAGKIREVLDCEESK